MFDQTRQLESLDPSQLDDHAFERHVSWHDACDGTMWGAVVNRMVVGERSEASYMRDPEAIRCADTGYSPNDIFLGRRYYTDDQLGVMDGPMRDKQPLVDAYAWTNRTPKSRLSKRQRAKLRRAKRRAARRAEKAITLTLT